MVATRGPSSGGQVLFWGPDTIPSERRTQGEGGRRGKGWGFGVGVIVVLAIEVGRGPTSPKNANIGEGTIHGACQMRQPNPSQAWRWGQSSSAESSFKPEGTGGSFSGATKEQVA